VGKENKRCKERIQCSPQTRTCWKLSKRNVEN